MPATAEAVKGAKATMSTHLSLLLLPLLLTTAIGAGLEDKKVPFHDMVINVQEKTPVPYALYQFEKKHPDVNEFRVKGEGRDIIKVSKDGWLYLDKALNWSEEDNYVVTVEALADGRVIDGPIFLTINVEDINDHAPYFNQSDYAAVVRENHPAGSPFTRVFAMDQDDPHTPNAQLRFSLVSQIPRRDNVALFQIHPVSGEVSTTEEGERLLKAREGIQFTRGEEGGHDSLKKKFDDYCPGTMIPYELNPFFTCLERAETRRRNLDPLDDPDYVLFVRVQDLNGASEVALSGNAKVNIAVKPNLWVNPGPLLVKENLHETYPLAIAKVQSNDPKAVYKLMQKEREQKFPFKITEDGEVLLTEPLDREEKHMYILVVLAHDIHQNEVDTPMEIQVIVVDVNDNAPECLKVESVFEVQEGEPAGSLVGQLMAADKDDEDTLNAQLTYKIVSSEPLTSTETFSIDAASGQIQALQTLQRKQQQLYKLTVLVSDPDYSTECQVVIKVIDVNNEMPLFEQNRYESPPLTEDTPVGHTVLTLRATDADDPDSGSSKIEFHITAGDDDGVFTVETDGGGVGHLVIAKPLDFEMHPTYNLQIDARNPEPLMKGLEYGSESTAFVSLTITDVDEVPEFNLDILEVTVPENISRGALLLTVEAKDPEGKEISFKMEGDSMGWLELDPASGQIKTKDKLDREALEVFTVTITAFEKENPSMSSQREVSVRLLDVNDNTPKPVESEFFICVKKPKPVIIRAQDPDNAPFSQPFTFTFAKKYSNWHLQTVDGASAKLSLKKTATEDHTFPIAINIKDNAGMGVTHSLHVRVCNCTELGYCYMPPESRTGKLGMASTIGILAGVLGFVTIIFIIVIKQSSKNKKRRVPAVQETNTLM
ncbi:cadherin-17 [Synchiropus splendidus]|uniref:cadherin-17 n=1 Tax=Synchiropus splendidus TaxID=270530 RepID=UPI00237DD850|nr:cadherin-17 [Synchiropus splendidus]